MLELTVEFSMDQLFREVKYFVFKHSSAKFLIKLKEAVSPHRNIFVHSYIMRYLLTEYANREDFIGEIIERIAEK